MVLKFSEFLSEKIIFDIDDFYQKSLKDEYWKNTGDLYPNYNSPDSEDNNKAVEYIFKSMKNKYININLDSIEKELKIKIKDGLA